MQRRQSQCRVLFLKEKAERFAKSLDHDQFKGNAKDIHRTSNVDDKCALNEVENTIDNTMYKNRIQSVITNYFS